ncbi:MAG TPA: 16S rRNA (guanine(966)-N(2))-methyltransferase RsmD [Ktedonobacterales bacterium]|nr:16S rRNA (guanine(966)-N(2))-methyltransferase RsmD [Ktedonobacterales bacterium]
MRIVAGEAKGRRLKHPKTAGTRPVIDRVKTALFDILGERVVDARFLDLFAGTGAVGLEALSRGAAQATFIELSQQVAAVLRENLRTTGLAEHAEVIRGDAFRFLDQAAAQGRRYDMVYIAPPQYHQMAAKALAQVEHLPLTEPGALAIVQIFPKERVDLDQLPLRTFRQVDERRYGSTLLLFYEHRSDVQAEG